MPSEKKKNTTAGNANNTMSEQKGKNKRRGGTHIPRRLQKIGSYPSCDQTCAWTAKETTTRQQNRNKCNKVNK